MMLFAAADMLPRAFVAAAIDYFSAMPYAAALSR